MASLLKSIAIAASAGIAVGLVATSSKRASLRDPADDILRFEPLLDRLERLEARTEIAEPQRQPVAHEHLAPVPPASDDLTRRIEAQESELQVLRARFDEIPSLVEFNIKVRLAELEARIESQVEAKVSERIGAIERTLALQSSSMQGLKERGQETDAHLKRLILAIERLCERIPQPAGGALLPFEAQMAEAAQREPVFEPQVRVIKEKEPEGRKSRFPLARIFAFVMAVALPRFLR